MKRKTIQLIVLVGVLVLLLAGYLLLGVLSGTEDDSGDDIVTPDTTYRVCAVDQTTVYKIAYTRNGTEYAYTLKEDATGWVWNDDLTLPLDNLYFANMVSACAELTSTVRLTDVSAAQLVEYGLGDNALKISFTDEPGGARAYRVGAYNSFNGMCYFCTEDDLTTVYMVSSALTDAFAFTPYDMIKLPDLPTDITVSNIVRLTLTPPKNSTSSAMTYTYYAGGKSEGEQDVWYVSRDGGEETLLDAATGKSLSTALTTLAFSGLVSYRADEQATLGLDDPLIMTVDYQVTQGFEDQNTGKVTYVNVDKSFTLHLGDLHPDSGLCYATVEGSPLSCTLMGTIFGELVRAAATAPIQ